MAQATKTPAQVAAYDAMKAAEARFRTERTDEAAAAYKAANAAYNAAMPAPKGQWLGRGNSAGKRQHREQAARTAEAVLRSQMARQWRR